MVPDFADDTAPAPVATDKNKGKPAKVSEGRPSRAAEPVTAVTPRDMTKFRDRIGEIRDKAIATSSGFAKDLVDLYTDFDRIDLRFRVHYDPSTKKPATTRKPK